jgi:hypothetical protein
MDLMLANVGGPVLPRSGSSHPVLGDGRLLRRQSCLKVTSPRRDNLAVTLYSKLNRSGEVLGGKSAQTPFKRRPRVLSPLITRG